MGTSWHAANVCRKSHVSAVHVGINDAPALATADFGVAMMLHVSPPSLLWHSSVPAMHFGGQQYWSWRAPRLPMTSTRYLGRPHVMLFCIGSLCLFAICRGCNSYWCSDEGGKHFDAHLKAWLEAVLVLGIQLRLVKETWSRKTSLCAASTVSPAQKPHCHTIMGWTMFDSYLEARMQPQTILILKYQTL